MSSSSRAAVLYLPATHCVQEEEQEVVPPDKQQQRECKRLQRCCEEESPASLQHMLHERCHIDVQSAGHQVRTTLDLHCYSKHLQHGQQWSGQRQQPGC